jgi:PKD repeat protein
MTLGENARGFPLPRWGIALLGIGVVALMLFGGLGLFAPSSGAPVPSASFPRESTGPGPSLSHGMDSPGNPGAPGSTDLSQVMVPTGTREPAGTNAVLASTFGPAIANTPLAHPDRVSALSSAGHEAPLASYAWSSISTTTAPSPRAGAAIAYDALDGYVVLFGGESTVGSPGNMYYLGDTWTYVAGVWTNITATAGTAPSPRYGALMTYDPVDSELVLLGGFTVSSGPDFVNDTWTFSHGVWAQSTTFPRQPFPIDDELTYDSVNSYVMFAGITESNPQNYGQVWSFLGGVWTLEANSDPGLQWDPLAFDSNAGYVLQLGGNGSLVTYEWNGSWYNVNPSSEPPMNGWQPIADDPAAAAVIYPELENWRTGQSEDTWAFSNGAWTNLTPMLTLQPSMRLGPSITYDAADGYLLLFGGASSTTYFDDSWAFTAPSPSITTWDSATPNGGSSPLTVQLNAWSTGGSGPITYAWHSSDGWEGTGPAPQHTFTSPGTYRVRVWANDTHGGWGTNATTVYVVAGLSVSISASPTSGTAPLTVDFTSTVTGGSAPYTYDWDFGTGSKTPNPNPVYTYSAAGTYGASVTVTDSQGHVASSNVVTITVSPVAGALQVTAYDSASDGNAPLNESFTCTVTGGTPAYSYVWNFGDGGTSILEDPYHTYTSAGTYSATVTVTDAASNTATSNALTIVVSPAPLSVSISASPSSGPPPLDVAFTSTVQGGTSPYTYAWTFGDGGTSTVADPSHTYGSAGNYQATLTVTDWLGHTAGMSLVVHVAFVNAQASATPTSGMVPLSVQFNGTATGGVAPYAWRWNWSHGPVFSYAENPQHTFNQTGGYSIMLKVTDSVGNVAWAFLQLTVTNSNGSLGTTSSASPTSGPIPLPVSFFSYPYGGLAPYSYVWHFGDGGASGAADPSHTYLQAGTYTVWLWVNDSRGASVSNELTITATSGGSPLNADPSATPSAGPSPLNVSFQANPSGGSGPYSAAWQFGDGASENGVLDPYHVYATAGTYAAEVVVTDSLGATANASLTIDVSSGCPTCSLSATAAYAPRSLEVGETATFWGNATGGVSPYVASWAFGDAANGTGTVAYHDYANAGTYLATVEVFDADGHEAVASVEVIVTACSGSCGSGSPSVALSVSPSQGSWPLTDDLTATVSGGTAPYTLVFCFGDGSNCLTLQETGPGTAGAVHTYETAGTYSPTVTVTDANGKEAAASAEVRVTGSSALSIVAGASPTTGVAPLNVSFWANISGGSPPYTLTWYFGDGDQGSGVSGAPTYHVYAAAGSYRPWLVVSDSSGSVVNTTLPTITVSSAQAPAKPASISTTTLLIAGLAAAALGVVGTGVGALLVRSRRRSLRDEGKDLVSAMEQDARPPPPPSSPPIRGFT